MLDRLKTLQARYEEISEQLTQPEVLSDMNRVTALSKELKEVSEIVKAGREYQNLLRDQAGAKEILEQESDEELREMAKEELIALEPKLEVAEKRLKQLLVPKDPNDAKSAILEIRAGTGGDEAALFAEDLFKMYQRFCDQNALKMEVTYFSEGGAGGYKEIIATVSGPDAYGTLKFESGVHRVQRVPDTETQGRIHTSAATVMVLPEAEDVDVELREQDIRKDTFCASGNGGQSVNTTYSAVRLTHLPTGLVVSMQNEKSQIKNLDLAMRILKARLYDLEMQKRHAEETALRRSLVSSGDRSAKIRTYNYPQSRVTDHRIGLTVYNLPGVLGGQLTEFIEALRLEETSQRMGEGTMA